MKLFACIFVIAVLADAVRSDDSSEKQHLKHPCGSSSPVSLDCVRSYFDEHGECSVITSSDNEPVHRKRLFFHIPIADMEVIDHNAQLKNLTGTIEKFYLNKETGNLVMRASFEGVTYSSPASYFHFTRKDGSGRFRVQDHITATYPYTFIAEMVLEDGKITSDSVKEAMVSSVLPDSMKVDFGSKLTETSDPDIQRSMAALGNNLPQALHEIFFIEGPSHFLSYVQKHVCDFGIPLFL